MLVSVILLGTQAHADGVSDLKSALARLQGQSPLKAQVDAKTWNRQGDSKETDETQGAASVTVEEGARGLSVLYSKDMLAKLEAEERNKERDAKAKTPTLSALSEVNSSSLRPMLSAASVLSRSVEKAVFKSEKPEAYNGRPARVLRFDMPIDKLTEKERKYMKNYEGVLDIWIAEDGTPLASRSSVAIAARAFLVVSFDAKNDEDWVYTVVGDRLVALRKETRTSGSGMGEKGEGKTIKTLQVLS
ncbi:MAG: hypothetical protein CFE43_13845 [Burkholderiales bacterium PBB3]|nr:MAG: hypothetical protein CFE43_13845 [Burkholderiales bacterium PBB3]